MSLLEPIKQRLLPAELRQDLSAARTSIRDLRERRVRTIQIYATNRCNSRCIHCYVWQYKNNVDLPVEIIASVLESKCLAPVNDVCLEGGEFTLHPRYLEILDLFRGRQVCVITNGILTSRVVEMVGRAPISKLIVSLDGTRETYARLRGLDVYDRVIETLKQVKDHVKVSLNFTITPWNDARDYEHVRNIAEDLGLDLPLPNIYTVQPYFKTVEPPAAIMGKHEGAVIRTKAERRYLDLHDPWLRGQVQLPCVSIFRSALVYPEGDVSFCHQRVTLIGNLHERSLDEIWTSEETRRKQDSYLHCNGCWCTPHRLQDVRAEKLGRLMVAGAKVRSLATRESARQVVSRNQ